MKDSSTRSPGVELPRVFPDSIDLVDVAEELMTAPDESAARALLASRRL